MPTKDDNILNIAVLKSLLEFLTEKGRQKKQTQKQIAEKIAEKHNKFRGKDLSEAIAPYNNDRKTFGGLSREEIISEIKNIYRIRQKEDGAWEHIEEVEAVSEYYALAYYAPDNGTCYRAVVTIQKWVDGGEIEIDYRVDGASKLQRGTLYFQVKGYSIHAEQESKKHAHYIFDSSGDNCFLGTYCQVGNKDILVAGVFYMKKVETLGVAHELIHQALEDPFLTYRLNKRRMQVLSGIDIENTFYKVMQERLKEIAGVYGGYYIIKNKSGKLYEFCMEIFADGSIVYKDKYVEDKHAEDNRGWVIGTDDSKEVLSLIFKGRKAGDIYNEFSYTSFLIELLSNPKHTVFKGIYAGLSRRTKKPIGGWLYMQRLIGFKYEQINPSEVNLEDRPAVAEFLETRKDIADALDFFLEYENSSSKNADLLRSARERSKNDANIQSIAGLYEGYVLRINQRESNELVKLIFEIKPNGDVRFKDPFSDNHSFDARCEKIISNNIIYCEISSRHLENPHMGDALNICYYLRIKNNGDLDGLYAGKSRRMDNITAGRIKLYKLPDNVSFDNIKPDTYAISKMAEKVGRERATELERFFLGKEDNYIEHIKLFREANWLPDAQIDPEYLEKITGNYYCYWLSTHDNEIGSNPIRILPDGKVIMKSSQMKTPQSNKTFYYGTAHIFSTSYLAIIFHKRNDTNQYQSSIYYIGESERLTFIQGVSTWISPENGELHAARQFLVRVEDDSEAHFESLFSQSTPIPPPFATPEKDSNFAKLNDDFRGLAKFLQGKEDNLIAVKNKIPQKNSDLKKDSNYGQILFGAACYECSQGGTDLAKDYLKRALENGFSDKALLKKEISEGGMLGKISEWVIKKWPILIADNL